MSSVLVTGATGFIGGALAARLVSMGVDVHVVVRPGSDGSRVPAGCVVHVHDGELCTLEAILADARPDVVFHLASLFLTDHQASDIDRLIDANIRFGLHLLEAMRRTGVTRLINTGTSWQYFGSEGYHPVNLYAATKQAFEDLLAYYHEACAFSVITLKLFDTYGPGDRRRKLINILVEAVRAGVPIGLSPGEQVLDLTHVDDVVSAFLRADQLQRGNAPVLADYFVSGERLSIRQLVACLEEVSGVQGFARFGERPYREREVMRPVAPGSRALPGWAPVRSIREAVKAMIADEGSGARDH